MKNKGCLLTALFCLALAGISGAQVISSFPHTENFESFTLCTGTCATPCVLSGGWTNASGDQTDWTTFSGATTTVNTGPDADHTLGTSAGKYLYVESSSCSNNTASLLTPPISLSAVSNLSISFWYHLYGNNMGTIHVDASTDGGVNFTDDIVPSFSQNSNFWTEKIISLNAYVGDTVIIRIRGVTGNGSLSDIGIDDFSFYELAGTDAGVVSISSPTLPLSPGVQNVAVSIKNFGTADITSVSIGWSVNGVAQFPYSWTDTLTSGQISSPITIGTYNFPQGTTLLKVWTFNPNNLPDSDNGNDTLDITYCTAFSGTFTIGGSNPDFTDFIEAVNSLSSCGINGPVVFNVDPGSGPYFQQLNIPHINGSSANNTITFNGNGETLSFNADSSDRHVIKLDGAKHVTINDLVIEGSNANYAWGIHLLNQADSNVIRNCTIDISANNSTLIDNSAGIVATASAISVSAAGNNASNLRIENNIIIGGYQGIRLQGQSSNAVNHIITGNTIRDFYSYGIFLGNCDQALVSENDISRANALSVGTFYGIDVDAGTRRTRVEKNRIHSTHNSAINLSNASYGIAILNADASSGNENIVANNAIYDFNSNGTIYGIYNSGSDGAYFYHNTIALDHTASSGGITRGFYQSTTASNIQFKNNIVTVTRGGTGGKYCVYFNSPGSVISSDYNVFFTDTTMNFIGYWNGSDFQSLADWQSANIGAYDAKSIFANPQYTSAGSGDFTPTNPGVDATGQSGLSVTDDILGNPRDPNNPDAGAFEFSVSLQDAMLSWVSPIAPVGAGNRTITVNLSNNASSQSNITSASLSYTDGSPAVTQTFTGLNIPPGGNQNLSFTITYNLSASVTLKAYINNINGVTEQIQYNDTAAQAICPALSGIYTINKNLPASSTNFQSFGSAVAALTACGVLSSTTFNVTAGSGPYFEQFEIETIPGAGAGNTVVINGNGNTINTNPTSANRAIIRLNGADYVTLNDLLIVGTDTSYGWGIHLLNQADHNTINNCDISFPPTSTSFPDNFVGIVATASNSSISAPGNTANHTVISNCDIASKGNGIRLNGMAGGKIKGNKITGSTIRDFYSNGIYLSQTDSTEITGNDIHRSSQSNVGTFNGIILSNGCENTLIERNRIHNTHDAASGLSGAAYAIYFDDADASAGNENRAINNLIYNFNGNGIISAIHNSGSDYAAYYHNTIVLDEATSTSSDITQGFRQETVATGVDFRNNIVFVKRGGIGTKHCIFLASSGSSVTSDHNVLVMDAAGGASNYTGSYNGVNYLSLANWKTANAGAFDQNSSDNDPVFADAGNDNYIPTSAAVNDMGTGVGVNADFSLNPRSATSPDPGAFEFSPAAIVLDAAISWVSPIGLTTPGQKTITVNITNLQSVVVTDVSLSYTDGNSVINQSFTNLSIDSGENADLIFTTSYNFISSVYLRAYINSVNGISDDNRLNDTTNFQLLCLPFSGSFTINRNAPLSGTNFQSFNDAIDALVLCGISGPVVFDVVAGSGPYNEQVSIPLITGSSAANTITFIGNNNELSFSPTTASRYVLRLDGTRHLTLQNLNIKGTNADYGYGIMFSNAADSNTVSGCTVDVSAVTNTSSNSNSCAILFSSAANSTSATGINGSYNTISNSTIIGGHYGVRVNGSTAAQNKIENNVIRNFYAYGVYLQDADGTEITGNDITRANRVDVTTFNGIYLSNGNVNTLVEGNRIHNTHDNASTRSQASNGINFSNCDAPAGQENKVINNAIYNMNGQGVIYGIFNTSSDGAFYYHNTISLDEPDTVGGQTIGFYQSTFADNIDFRNNIISVKRSGSGNKYCVAFGSITSNITCDYNVFYTPSDTSHFVGQLGATNYASLSQWQTASGNAFDQNSLFADPAFASPATGNLTPLNGSINDKGAALGISTDINGNARSITTPDIGAFEFTPSQFDATVISLIEPVNYSCGSGSISVSAVISNFGYDTVSATSITVNITGGVDTSISAVSNAALANGQTDTVDFGSISFTLGGTLNFEVIAQTSGDFNATNDTLRTTVIINQATAQPSVNEYRDTVCTGMATTIDVSASLNLTYTWFDMPTGGSPLHIGPSFTTPTLNASTIYYVEAASPYGYKVGPADNSIGAGGNFTNVGGQGLLFETFKYLTLDSVSVYANDTGTVYVEVTDPANNVIYGISSARVQTTGTKMQIPVGITLAPGSYRIDGNGSTTNGLYRNTSGANYPYSVPGIISITGNTNVTGNYFYFYDWKITAYDCPSERTAAPVFVDSILPVFATFSYSTNGTGLNVTFSADDSLANSYIWNFGDGETSTGVTTFHQYGSDGSYTACLAVENSCSQDNSCELLTLCGPFESSFDYDAVGQGVSFQYDGIGVPATYFWDFGDNSTSTDDSPSHTYQSAGVYTVTLIAENLCGESDTSSEDITICETVDAQFTLLQLAPGSLVFDFTSTSTGNPSLLIWDFGDGIRDTTVTATTHTFPSHGTYDVLLIATDACGAVDSSSQSIVTCQQPSAEFIATVQNDGATVNIVNNSSGNNISYEWNFGDNSTSSLETPTHSYSATGTYTITLTVKDACLQEDTQTQNVSIIVGIDELQGFSNVTIYPNPNNGEFIIEYVLSGTQNIKVELINVLGRIVYENLTSLNAGKHSADINVSGQPKGIYMLHLQNDQSSTVKSIIIQ